jgi:hypothetical protein
VTRVWGGSGGGQKNVLRFMELQLQRVSVFQDIKAGNILLTSEGYSKLGESFLRNLHEDR